MRYNPYYVPQTQAPSGIGSALGGAMSGMQMGTGLASGLGALGVGAGGGFGAAALGAAGPIGAGLGLVTSAIAAGKAKKDADMNKIDWMNRFTPQMTITAPDGRPIYDGSGYNMVENVSTKDVGEGLFGRRRHRKARRAKAGMRQRVKEQQLEFNEDNTMYVQREASKMHRDRQLYQREQRLFGIPNRIV